MCKEHIGKAFNNAQKKHIPKGHILHPVLNNHTLPHIKVIIEYHAKSSIQNWGNNSKIEREN